MAASHEMVERDVQLIEAVVRQFASSMVVEQTNKRTIIWCPDLVCAKNLSFRIKDRGYHVDVRRGLKTSAIYVQAWY